MELIKRAVLTKPTVSSLFRFGILDDWTLFVSDSSAVGGGSATRKRRVPEADAVRVPLTKGWRRQTYIRGISLNCVRGDVIYFAPCGKRLGSYAEVARVSAVSFGDEDGSRIDSRRPVESDFALFSI